MAAAADMEDGGGGAQHHPQPAPEHALPPGGLVGVDDAGGPHLFEQILDDRFAGDPDLAQAAVEGAHRQRHAEPGHQELTDASAGLMVAHRQGRDEGGQRRADQTAFGQQQVPLAVSLEREHADAGTGRCLPAARAPHHLVAVLHAADPDAAVGALQLQNCERLRRADDRVPHLER
jgi:hypothetical protein